MVSWFMEIVEEERFKEVGGKLIMEIIGGSTLYGLNTPTSDVDYRGIFIATHPHYASGMRKVESFVQLDKEHGRDSAYYELKHFLHLCNKTNTQMLELLFAPESAFNRSTRLFDEMRFNARKLINSETLKKSLVGYVHSEMKLARGDRSGQLGGKRKESVEKFGFSPKNFTQIFRLLAVGKEFFRSGEFVVNVKNYNEKLWEELMSIKCDPTSHDKEELTTRVYKQLEELQTIMDNSSIKYEFDMDFASRLILGVIK
jgi:predicted nucleotidyltransferase